MTDTKKLKLPEKLILGDDFKVPEYDEWRAQAEKDLKGDSFDKKLFTSTYENILLKPIYTKQDTENLELTSSLPGFFPYLRGTSITGTLSSKKNILQEINCTNNEEFNKELQISLKRGQTGILLNSGLTLQTSDDFAVVLQGIDITKYPLYIHRDNNPILLLNAFGEYCQSANIDVTLTELNLIYDPLGDSLSTGKLKVFVEEIIALEKIYSAVGLNGTFISINGLQFLNAGASAVQELGYSFSQAIEYINVLGDSKIDPKRLLNRISFNFGLSTNFFTEIAKLRAARIIWAKICEVYGAPKESAKIKICAKSSEISNSKLDEYVNLLRVTTESFAAYIGGADTVTSTPFNSISGNESSIAERIARNTQIILQEEAHLGKVIDPAGGSYYVESLTNEIAQLSWKLLQAVDEDGGFFDIVKEAKLQTAIENVATNRKIAVNKRKSVLIGTNQFANLKETAPNLDRVTQKIRCQSPSDKSPSIEIYKLTPVRLSEPFEEMRAAVAKHKEKTGSSAKIFLATMGSVKQHKGRADFARAFYETGGFEVVYPGGFNSNEEAYEGFLSSGCNAVVICSTDDTYPDIVPGLTKMLKEQNSTLPVLLAGYPKEQIEAHKAAGIDDFIYLGCDVVSSLQLLMLKIGVQL